MLRRRTTCLGCEQPFTARAPAVHQCHFRDRGFPLTNTTFARPCGVQYHADCVRAGELFRTCLDNHKGLVYPVLPHIPHFICELCQAQAIMEREVRPTISDSEVLLLERMRLIDTVCWRQKSTMSKYGPYLNFLARFRTRYQVPLLQPARLHRPPTSEAIPLIWAQLLYSLREDKGHRIKYGSILALRSASSLFYTLDQQAAFAGKIRRSNKRHEICEYVAPNQDVLSTFATKGMARRIGTETKPSWALSHNHIAYLDRRLRQQYEVATTLEARHELACAGLANLTAYLGWLQSAELFEAEPDSLGVISPAHGPLYGLPPQYWGGYPRPPPGNQVGPLSGGRWRHGVHHVVRSQCGILGRPDEDLHAYQFGLLIRYGYHGRLDVPSFSREVCLAVTGGIARPWGAILAMLHGPAWSPHSR
jgi:hypothetical protein